MNDSDVGLRFANPTYHYLPWLHDVGLRFANPTYHYCGFSRVKACPRPDFVAQGAPGQARKARTTGAISAARVTIMPEDRLRELLAELVGTGKSR